MQYIEEMDQKIKASMEFDELLGQAVAEERYDDAARLRKQVQSVVQATHLWLITHCGVLVTCNRLPSWRIQLSLIRATLLSGYIFCCDMLKWPSFLYIAGGADPGRHRGQRHGGDGEGPPGGAVRLGGVWPLPLGTLLDAAMSRCSTSINSMRDY